jgi:hypothetical protein
VSILTTFALTPQCGQARNQSYSLSITHCALLVKGLVKFNCPSWIRTTIGGVRVRRLAVRRKGKNSGDRCIMSIIFLHDQCKTCSHYCMGLCRGKFSLPRETALIELPSTSRYSIYRNISDIDANIFFTLHTGTTDTTCCGTFTLEQCSVFDFTRK